MAADTIGEVPLAFPMYAVTLHGNNTTIAYNSQMMAETGASNSSWNTYTFDIAVGVWLPGIICGLGILGNVLSFVVLSMDRSASPSFLTLKALALSDIILLLAALCQQVLPLYAYLAHCANALCLHYLAYIRVYIWPIVCIAQMNSVYLTVLISAERYAAICQPLRTKGIRRLPKIRLAICIVAIFSILFNIPKFFEFVVVKEKIVMTSEDFNTTWILMMEDTLLRRHPLYRYLYNTALYCLILYTLPLIVLTLLNISIVRKMRSAHKRWGELNRTMQRELKATAVPLCIVVVFVICGTQALVAFVLDAVFVHADKPWLQMFTAIVNLFVIFNSAVNFIIFYLFGSKFRRLLRRALIPSCLHSNRRLQTGSPLLRRRFKHRYSPALNSEISSNGHQNANWEEGPGTPLATLNVNLEKPNNH